MRPHSPRSPRSKTFLPNEPPRPAVPSPDYGPRPTGSPLAARDEYGSRFLLAAPFGYGDGEAGEHWYAWDVDACWLDVARGLGTFGSVREALHRWREAAGPAAAGAELTPCAPGLAGRLLAASLDDGTRGESMRGDEPRDLFAEYYREKRRARELARSPGFLAEQDFTIDMDRARDEFLAWYASRHGAGSVTPDMADAIDAITDQWGPHKDIDEAAFYACSPHRVGVTARLLRHDMNREHAAPAFRLLPEWTQWCIERGNIGSAAASRARGAALSASAAGTSATAPAAHASDGPFCRRE